MKRFLIPWLAGLLACVLLLEMVCRLLPVNSAPRMQDTSDAAPVRRFHAHQDYVYSFGWAFGNAQRGRSNALGFNHAPDEVRPGGLLLLGDSYIEAQMLPTPSTLQARLEARFPGQVTSVAASVNGLADHLQNARRFAPEFRSAVVVVQVESGDVADIAAAPAGGHTAFVETQGVIRSVHQPYTESAFKTRASASALFRYLYYNLKVQTWRPSFWRAVDQVVKPGTASVPAAEQKRRMLSYFFDEWATLAKQDNFRTVFLLDADRRAIYQPGRPELNAWTPGDREMFLSLAGTAGLEVIDLQGPFARHWQTTRERVDFSPMDYHWNATGNRIVARELASRIQLASSPQD